MPTITTTTTETVRLAELIGRKHDLLAQLCDLGRRQIEFIQAGDMSQLFKVLAAKQRLLTALQTAERDLEPFRKDDPEARQWSSVEARRHCAEVRQRCENLLAEIICQERDSEQQLLVRRDETVHQLQGLHLAANTRAAYADETQPLSGQLDLSTDT